jgi:nucleoside-triphosphatase
MKNFLLTGLPGIGKTSLIMKMAELLNPARPAGFYTSEIREGGMRTGFEIRGLGGERAILSHVNIQSPHKVGKYGVDLNAFESYLNSADLLGSPAPVIIIDEIGKMECYSKFFQDLVTKLLDSEKIVVASVSLRGDPFIDQIKTRKDIRLFVVLRENRDELAEILRSHIIKITSSPGLA